MSHGVVQYIGTVSQRAIGNHPPDYIFWVELASSKTEAVCSSNTVVIIITLHGITPQKI
jgi:hypothetical protein